MKSLFLPLLAVIASSAVAQTDDHSAQWYLSKDDVHIVLNAGQFNCPEGQHRALLTNPTGGWEGCWRADDEYFYINWEDGDTLAVPRSSVKKMKGHPRPGDLEA